MYPVLKRIFLENFRVHLPAYVVAIACLVTIAGTTAFTAWIMDSVVNETFANRRADLILPICSAIFAAFLLRGFATYGQAVALSSVGNAIVADYQKRIFSHLMKLSVGFFADTRSAQLAATINQNIAGIRDILNMTVTSTARDVLTLIALIGVMITKDPLLFLIVLVVAPPLVATLSWVSHRVRHATREAIELNSHVLGAMQETVQGISIVKAFTMEGQLSRQLYELIETAERRANKIARLSERTAPLTEGFAGAAISGVLAYAGYRAIYQNIPPGAFFSFVTALLLAYDPARRLTRTQVQMERAAVSARMIYELLDLVPDQPDSPQARDLAVTRGDITFEGVSFAYGRGEPVLSDVTFTAKGGQMTALVGPSGAGKSTVISLIPRFYDPSAGRILIDGQDIASVTKESLRRSIAYVSQQPYLFEGSIRDNIRYGRPEATDAEIEAAATLAFAHDFILAQPQGYDTPVGENGVTLSGGQRQRLSIARALVRNAPILLLDEATSALDTESEAAVQKALDNAMVGRTVVVIAHRLSTVVNAESILVMQAGQIVETGTHDTLSAMAGGVYQRLHNLQAPSSQPQQDVIS